nr:monosaccharide-sensing protein 3-like [Setaria viridis]
MLQGWDNASIAAAMFDIREEFHLQSMLQIESLVVAIGIIGAMIITTFIGSLADTFVHHGRADEAKKVLERLRTTKYSKGQMTLLIEGTGGR